MAETIGSHLDTYRMKSFCGGRAALLRELGIDLPEPESEGAGTTRDAADRDGRVWTLKFDGTALIDAERPMTDEEIAAADEKVEANSFVSYFRQDRLRLCRAISLEVATLTRTLGADKPCSRSRRRELRNRIDELVTMQYAMMTMGPAEAKQYRPRLEELGVV